MFPGPGTASSPTSRTLRGRLVRGLDVAVEFATLGEYGVEEVQDSSAEPSSGGWDWPPRCSGRGRPSGLPPRTRLRAGVGAACA
jgi:hypothetical protein